MLGYLLFFKCLVVVFFYYPVNCFRNVWKVFTYYYKKYTPPLLSHKKVSESTDGEVLIQNDKKNDWRGSSSRFQRFKLAKRNCISSVLTYWVFTSSSILIVTQPHIANHSNRSILLENWFVLLSILDTQ